jgi:flagellar basal body P-ring formation protein FlgA
MTPYRTLKSTVPKMSLTILAMLGLMLLFTGAAFATEARRNVTIDGPQVMLSDLFSDIGQVDDIVAAAAPLPGERGYITSSELSSLARSSGLNWVRPSGFLRTIIVRRGILLGDNDMRSILEDAIRSQGGPDRFNTILFGGNGQIFLPVDSTTESVTVSSFSIDIRTNRFSATLLAPVGNGRTRDFALSGRLEVLQSIPMLARAMSQDEIINEDDIIWQDVAEQRIGQNVILSARSLIGQSARRPLRAGTAIRASDVRKPILIRKGTLISMRITSGALSMSAVGRAMEDGGLDDIIRIVNIDSHHSIEGRITGPGQVQIMHRGSLAMANE